MAVPRQKVDVRPISFIFHDTADNIPPFEMKLVIRPEELTRSDTSRQTTHQTLGGAWIDDFGAGVPTVTLAGTTGWGSGSRPDGQQVFQDLYELVYKRWHADRARLVEKNKDPDLIKLIFRDQLDDFVWVVAPTQFVLQRSKSRPLLSQYRISLTQVSDNVSETLKQLISDNEKKKRALGSLDQALQELNTFAGDLAGDIDKFFGPIREGVDALVGVTTTVLNVTRSVINSGFTVVDAVTGNLTSIAASLSLATSNVFMTVLAVQSIPAQIKARIMRARTLLLNAFCILQNTFKPRQILPNFDDVYGASLCSSTAGGRPLSKYLGSNTFEDLHPIIKDSPLFLTQDAHDALTTLERTDPVLYPGSLTEVGLLAQRAAAGIMAGLAG